MAHYIPKFALGLLALLIASPLYAQDYEGCPSYPNVPITVNPRFDEPRYDYSANIPAIRALAGGDSRRGIRESITLGLTRYEPVLSFRVPIKTRTLPDGLSCSWVEEVEVTIGYKNVVVYIASEIPQNSCGFEKVLEHEQKHINVNRQILNEYVPKIQDRLASYLKLNGVFRQTNPDYASKLLDEKLNGILNDTAQQIVSENENRQHQVDTPEEYRRISYSCNGQLANISTQFLRNGR